jgi:hypothetical protein
MTVPHTISAMVSVVALAQTATWGLAQTSNIVGLGATPCDAFNRDVERNFQIQRDYFAWAQGFMSGVLMRAPPGIDEGLQLAPPTFPLLKQVDFLRSFCAKNPEKDYSDGVTELYRPLRIEKRSLNGRGNRLAATTTGTSRLRNKV